MVTKNGICINGHHGAGGTFIDCKYQYGAQISFANSSKFIRCEIQSDLGLYPGTASPEGVWEFIDCIFKPNGGVGYFTQHGGILRNCLFEEPAEIGTHPADNPVLAPIISYDHNQIEGNFKAWHKGGTIETLFIGENVQPEKLIFKPTDEDYPVFKDIDVILPANKNVKFGIIANKDFSGGTVKLEIIKTCDDPLIDSDVTPLESAELSDVVGVDTPLSITYNSEYSIPAKVRISVINDSGTVNIDTRCLCDKLALQTV
jgi:hypothetical protein